MIFDGKKFVRDIELQLKEQVGKLSKKPKPMAILDPKNMGSVVYTNLKEKFAQRIGVDFQRIETLNPNIETLNTDPNIDGIILQLPFPDSEKFISLINKSKDVDGLRDDSPFMPAAVRAVRTTLGLTATPSYVGGGRGGVLEVEAME